jgi:hypothetical protein
MVMNEEMDARLSKYDNVELDDIDINEFVFESAVAALMDEFGYDRGRAVFEAQELLNSPGLPGFPPPVD